MRAYVIRRLGQFIPVLLLATIIVWAMLFALPGSPALVLAGEDATPEQIAAIEARYGLDQPVWLQYLTWLGHALQGNFGTSIKTSEPVSTTISDRLPATLSLTLGAVVLAAVIGIALGVRASIRPGSVVDRLITTLASAALALPSFWVGILLSVFIGVKLGWLPAGGYIPFSYDTVSWFESLVLPWIALALPSAAVIARQTRSSMIAVLKSDYVRAALAAGVPRRTVLLRHALKNALTPVITVIAFQLVVILGASFVVEQAFNINGIGSMAVQAIFDRDLPLLQGTVLVVAVIVMLTNLLADVAFGWVNPKARA